MARQEVWLEVKGIPNHRTWPLTTKARTMTCSTPPSRALRLSTPRRLRWASSVWWVASIGFVGLSVCAAADDGQYGLLGRSFTDLHLEALKRAELLDTSQQEYDPGDCYRKTSCFFLRACVPPSPPADQPLDWGASGPASRPTTLDRMRASVELAQCEVAAAGLSTPAECQDLPQSLDLPVAHDHGAPTYKQLLRRCVESLSRSPQLWTSYVTASREFDTHCTKLQQARGVDQARDMWRAALNENARMIQSVQRAMEDWSSTYSGQSERLDVLARSVKHDMDALSARHTDISRQSEEIMEERLDGILRAAQQAQLDVLGASEIQSRELGSSLRAALEQQTETMKMHLASVQLAATSALDREMGDLLRPVQDDARLLSAELHTLRLAAMDVGTDILRASHGMRDLTASVDSLQISTELVLTDLSEISRQSALAMQGSKRTAHALKELEQLAQRKTASMGALLDRALGTRAVLFEAAIRMVLLYGPELLKSLLVPIVSMGLRGVSSLAGVAGLALGHAICGMLVWAVRLVRQRHRQRQALQEHEKPIPGPAGQGPHHWPIDEGPLPTASVRPVPLPPPTQRSGPASPRPRARALQYTPSLSNGFGTSSSASLAPDDAGPSCGALDGSPSRVLLCSLPSSDGLESSLGVSRAHGADSDPLPPTGVFPAKLDIRGWGRPAQGTPSQPLDRGHGSRPLLQPAPCHWGGLSRGSDAPDWRTSVFDEHRRVETEAWEVCEVEELV